jgi:hypothetical protein
LENSSFLEETRGIHCRSPLPDTSGGGGLWLTSTLVFAIRIFTLLIEFLKDQITTLHEYSHISQKLHQSTIQPKLREVFPTIQ